VEYYWYWAFVSPLSKQACDARVVMDLPKRVEAAEAWYQYDMKAVVRSEPGSVGHRSGPLDRQQN